MADGVPLESGLRRERKIRARMRREKIDFLKTMVIATAQSNPDNLQSVVQEYLEAVSPSEKRNEEFVEKNMEVLEQESQKMYGIDQVFQT